MLRRFPMLRGPRTGGCGQIGLNGRVHYFRMLLEPCKDIFAHMFNFRKMKAVERIMAARIFPAVIELPPP